MNKLTFDMILWRMSEKGLSQKDLADYLGLSEQKVSDWKTGRIKSYQKYIEEILIFLNISMDDLINSDGLKETEETIGNIKNGFCERFKTLLAERNITKYRFSKDTGLPTSTIQEWTENGKLPSVPKLIKISQYLGVSTDSLLGLDQDNRVENGVTLSPNYESQRDCHEYVISDSDINMFKSYTNLSDDHKQIIISLIKSWDT